MRLLLILVALGGTLRGADAEGESELPETGWTTEFSNRIQAVFEESAAIEHAGLLGRVYVQSRFTQSNVPNRYMRRYDRTAEIPDGLINLPLWTFDFPMPLKADLFSGHSEAKVEGARNFPSYYGYHTEWPESTYSYRRDRDELGITLFTEWNDRFRPFLQVGAKFDETMEVLMRNVGYTWFDSPIPWIDNQGTYYDSPNHKIAWRRSQETSLLLRPGFEFDLLDSLSYRMTIDVNSSQWATRTEFQNDLVYWPFRKLFMRGGVNTSFDGKYIAFSLGAGLVY